MENELSRVVDALAALVWTAPPDGHIDFVKSVWVRMHGTYRVGADPTV